MTKTLPDLIDRYAHTRRMSAQTESGEAYDYFKEATELRAEIARRLELVEQYRGTEASAIKAILATGRPEVHDYEAELAARHKLGDRAPQG
jgi:hypothetical protein